MIHTNILFKPNNVLVRLNSVLRLVERTVTDGRAVKVDYHTVPIVVNNLLIGMRNNVRIVFINDSKEKTMQVGREV